MNGQSRVGSAAESVANIGSGFVLSWAVWTVVGPWYGFNGSPAQNASICAIFTVVSLARSYVWRRTFNRFSVGDRW